MNDSEKKYCQNLLLENNTLRDELNAERFIIQQLTNLGSTDNLSDGIDTLLEDLGKYTCADRAYIFEINEDHTSTNTF